MEFLRQLIENLAAFWDRVQPEFWRNMKSAIAGRWPF